MIYAASIDTKGNKETPKSAPFMIDQTPPEGSITINDDDPYTNTTGVTLNLSATDATGISGYRITENTGGYQVAIDPISPFIADIEWDLYAGDGTKTVAVQYCDVSGNWSANYTDDILLDTTPPATTALLSGTEGDNGWYVSNVIVTLTADDPSPGSGVAAIYYALDDPEDVQTYLAPFTISTDGIHTVYYCAVDNAGNKEAVQTMEIKIDQTPPVFGDCPAGGPFLLNSGLQSVGPISVEDLISGLDAVASELSGSVDTSSVGPKDVTFTAVDNAGNSDTKDCTYSVVYDFGGFLPPVSLDGRSLFKLGSTIPVKFQLFDAAGNPVSTAVATIKVAKISDGVAGSEVEGVSTSAATTGNLFRYDLIGQLYIFNLATKPLPAPADGTWRITVYLNDGTSQSIDIGIKK